MLVVAGWAAPAKVAREEIDWGATAGWLIALAVIAGIVVLAVWTTGRTRARHEAYAAEAEAKRREFVAQQEEAQRRHAAMQLAAQQQAAQERWNSLCQRFGQPAAERILRREIWQGQTSAMLVEARGQPDDIDEKILKTKSKHVFKYAGTGAGRYGLRVMLENDVVVGWDDKR